MFIQIANGGSFLLVLALVMASCRSGVRATTFLFLNAPIAADRLIRDCINASIGYSGKGPGIREPPC